MSRERFLVTDLTRMSPSTVCVAGYVNRRGIYECVRPIVHYTSSNRGQIAEDWLYSVSQPIVPFSVIHIDLHDEVSDPPHIEDWHFGTEIHEHELILTESQRKAFLIAGTPLDVSVGHIFDRKFLEQTPTGWSVPFGSFCRSLGTVRVSDIRIQLRIREGTPPKTQYRIRLTDGDGMTYWLPFTDLAARRYCQSLLREEGLTIEQAAYRFQNQLYRSPMVLLRVGLARSKEAFAGQCTVLVTGIYSFPDYLDGRTHADFPRDYA